MQILSILLIFQENGESRPSAETVAKFLDEIAHTGAIRYEKALTWWNTNFPGNDKVVVSQFLHCLECPEHFNQKMYFVSTSLSLLLLN